MNKDIIVDNNKYAYNTEETCYLLGINRKLLDSFRKKGLIKSIKTGRYWIYPASEIESFLTNYLGKEITKDGIVYGC